MRRLLAFAALMSVVAPAGCAERPEALAIEPGQDVRLVTSRGASVSGRLVDVRPDTLVLETADGVRTEVRRSDISRLTIESTAHPPVSESPAARAVAPPPAPVTHTATAARPRTSDRGAGAQTGYTVGPASREPAPPAPIYRELTLPAGTVLHLELVNAVGSETSRVEDPVRATLRRPLGIDGVEALPEGTVVSGHVTAADRPGRVKGRGRIAFRFTSVDVPGDAERLPIRTETISRIAEATKKEDAAKIGGGAAGGAIIGGILGGGDGAAKGAAIGGAAGTGVVLATRGDDVRLNPGTALSTRLAEPLTVRVRQP